MVTHDTFILFWLAALAAPPIVFGVWLRVKLLLSDDGADFLTRRELAKTHAQWQTPLRLRDQIGESRGKLARSAVDLDALSGSHGGRVAALLRQTIPFMVGYAIYVVVVGGIGYLLSA